MGDRGEATGGWAGAGGPEGEGEGGGVEGMRGEEGEGGVTGDEETTERSGWRQ